MHNEDSLYPHQTLNNIFSSKTQDGASLELVRMSLDISHNYYIWIKLKYTVELLHLMTWHCWAQTKLSFIKSSHIRGTFLQTSLSLLAGWMNYAYNIVGVVHMWENCHPLIQFLSSNNESGPVGQRQLTQ